jgi:predicted transcriptional regulator
MTRQITVRLDEELLARLDKVTDAGRNPYAPSKRQVIERGLELALRELEKRK